MRHQTATSIFAALGLSGLHLVCPAEAQTVFGLTRDGNRLVSFSSASVGTIQSNNAITGLDAGETITNIDFRPRTGELFGLSSSNRLFTLNTATGAATLRQMGGATPFSITGQAGLDFNPTPDRIRVTTGDDRSLRLNPDTGGLVADDSAANGSLRFVSGDANFGVNPNVISVAYTNSRFGAVAPSPTTLYGIHRGGGFAATLVRIGSLGSAPDSPNNGNITTVASTFGLFSDDFIGFDIYHDGATQTDTGFYSGNPLVGGTAFYTIDLQTGSAAFMGNVGGASPLNLRDFSVVPSPGSMALVGIGGLAALRRRR